jgi:predicted protein tyrosine phosphatase
LGKAALKRVLFLCSRNRWRSPTAENVLSARQDIETDSAGLLDDAETVLSADQVEWAELIFVMEKRHRQLLQKRFRKGLNGKKVICLDIPDIYPFMDPALVRLLETKLSNYL